MEITAALNFRKFEMAVYKKYIYDDNSVIKGNVCQQAGFEIVYLLL